MSSQTAAQHKTEEREVIDREWSLYCVFTNLPGQWGYPCVQLYTHTLEDAGFLDFYNIPADKTQEFEHDNPKATRGGKPCNSQYTD